MESQCDGGSERAGDSVWVRFGGFDLRRDFSVHTLVYYAWGRY
jgi:hypothetical protein